MLSIDKHSNTEIDKMFVFNHNVAPNSSKYLGVTFWLRRVGLTADVILTLLELYVNRGTQKWISQNATPVNQFLHTLSMPSRSSTSYLQFTEVDPDLYVYQ